MFTVLHSHNVKVGDVAVTYAPVDQTCPSACPLKGNGCYAQGGNVGLHMRRLQVACDGINGDTVAALEGAEIADMGSKAPAGHPLRIHVSGDASTDYRALLLAKGAEAWPGPVWSYTHAWRSVNRHSWGRVSVLASCESIKEVVLAYLQGYAASLVVAKHPENGRAFTTPEGVKVIPCPAQTRDVKCTDCKLCWNDALLFRQRACVSFETHGYAKKRANRVLNVIH